MSTEWLASRRRKVYVASSWRNDVQPDVVRSLREAGHEVYDFKNPREGDHGFHWSEVGMPSYDRATNSDVPVGEYLAGIEHPIAQAGFKSDFDAMKWADTCVLVLPCGRSAHLELGWFVGNGRRTAIMLDGPEVTPELMYLMVDHLAPTVQDAVAWVNGLDLIPRRWGGWLECGCWTNKIAGGQAIGHGFRCDMHGLTTIAKTNVDEPDEVYLPRLVHAGAALSSSPSAARRSDSGTTEGDGSLA